MKILSFAALAMALSAGATFAQQPSDTTPPPSNTSPNTVAPESTSPQQTAAPSNEDRLRSDWRRGRGDRPMGRSGAARFYVQDGDVKIRIQCAEDEPTKVCTDLLLQMLDRLGGSSSSRSDRNRNRDRDRDRDHDRDSDD